MADLTNRSGRKIRTGKTRTSLICGFLGAGKTTFIRNRLRQSSGKTAVLVNEFGTLGLDGAGIFQSGGLQVVELPGGCICCSQQLHLEEAILDICRRFGPERLFIEPSGVAEASGILRVLTSAVLVDQIILDGVITVIDAETFLEYAEPDAFGTFFLDQIQQADLILINKGDLVSSRHLDKVEQKILALNNRALVTATSFGQLAAALPQRQHRATHTETIDHIAWGHACLEPVVPLPFHAIEALGAKLTEGFFGNIFRAKGVIPLAGGDCIELQAVGRRWQIMKPSSAISPRFICIGFDLRIQELAEFFSTRIPDRIKAPQHTILPYVTL